MPLVVNSLTDHSPYDSIFLIFFLNFVAGTIGHTCCVITHRRIVQPRSFLSTLFSNFVNGWYAVSLFAAQFEYGPFVTMGVSDSNQAGYKFFSLFYTLLSLWVFSFALLVFLFFPLQLYFYGTSRVNFISILILFLMIMKWIFYKNLNPWLFCSKVYVKFFV